MTLIKFEPHNPDGLAKSQFGDGFRPLLGTEIGHIGGCGCGLQVWSCDGWDNASSTSRDATYRVPLSVLPYPSLYTSNAKMAAIRAVCVANLSGLGNTAESLITKAAMHATVMAIDLFSTSPGWYSDEIDMLLSYWGKAIDFESISMW